MAEVSSIDENASKPRLTLGRRKYADIDALQAHRRLLQVDEFDAGDCSKDFGGAFHDTRYARMAVQRDPHFDPSAASAALTLPLSLRLCRSE